MKEAPSKYSAVCELHFHPSEVMKFDSYLCQTEPSKGKCPLVEEKAKYQKQNQIEQDEIIINYSEEESGSFFSEKHHGSRSMHICEDFLTSYHNLVRHCEKTEEAIKNYRKQWGTNSRGLVKLSA
ncbi:hypothetical protein NQ317_016206 [Molorchus minor]|uniref:THAP-type domain-containing protein n=1 Tax=Molorchus minor TaxID=1323400 RepID=A0ABQ9J863_9CUCU|nr:hypothetical protein NQ317_016206 [Molorchus minor]